MTLNELNVYLDGILSLSPDSDDTRWQLAELYDPSFTLVDLLRELHIIYGWSDSTVYAAKVWFSLSYADLAQIYSLDEKSISQIMRSERMRGLPPYRPQTTTSAGALSCFMVDQLLSPFIDLEIQESSVRGAVQEHLAGCDACSGRLAFIRQLDAVKWKERKAFKPFSYQEWEALQQLVKERDRFERGQWSVLAGLIFMTLGFAIWFLASSPAELPNIYEMRAR